MICAVTVAGCQSEPASRPTSVARPTLVPPTSVAPTRATGGGTTDRADLAIVPAAARAHTNQGAQAFAEFYLAQLNKAWSLPDPEAIRPYATASCKTCAAYVKTAESLRDAGEKYDRPP